ncbi:MAG TPA: MFS transporter [Micromonosporaceae bacterium]|jgi:MFS family permease
MSLGRDPDFRRYWWARSASGAGSVITLVALPVLVYRLSGSPLATAVASACEAAPYMAFGLIAGALADRWDRRRVMVTADVLNAFVVGSVPLAYALGVLTVAHALVVAVLGPAITVFFDGANFGALPLLVGRERIAHANALLASTSNSLETILPSVVGVGLAVIAPATMLVVDAASFVVSALLVAGIGRALHDVHRARSRLGVRTLIGEIADGLRFLRAHAVVRTMTMVGTLQSAAGGGFVALMVVWCDQVLGIGTSGLRFGLVYSAWGVGGIVAALALPRILRRMSPAVVTLRTIPFSAAFGVGAALAGNWILAALALLGWSMAYMTVAINSISLRQQVTPEQLLSRVNTAGRMLSWGVGWTGGAMLGGALRTVIGIHPAMFALAGLTVIATAVAWVSPLRRESAVPSQPTVAQLELVA